MNQTLASLNSVFKKKSKCRILQKVFYAWSCNIVVNQTFLPASQNNVFKKKISKCRILQGALEKFGKSNTTSTVLGVEFDRCLVEGGFKGILNDILCSVA